MEEIKEIQNTNKPETAAEASKLSPDEQMIQDGFEDLLKDYLNSNHRRLSLIHI